MYIYIYTHIRLSLSLYIYRHEQGSPAPTPPQPDGSLLHCGLGVPNSILHGQCLCGFKWLMSSV